MRYAFIFWLMGLAWLAIAYRFRGYGWIAAWPGMSFALVGLAYGGIGPGIFGKQRNGKLSIWTFVLLLPYVILAWASWAIVRLISSEPACSEVAPGVWVGRRPVARELPSDVQTLVDLTCELWEPRSIRRLPAYVCEPTLDERFPRTDRATELIRRLALTPGSILLHCAQGHGRSAALAAAVMVARGLATDIDDACQKIKLVRPQVRVRSFQRVAAGNALKSLDLSHEHLSGPLPSTCEISPPGKSEVRD